METKDDFKMYYIYKYVYQGEIIYIGKTKRNLSERIYEHSIEQKFLPYLNTVQIYYFTLPTHVEMDIYEKYFINKYMPKLNVIDKEGANFVFTIQEPMWILYEHNHDLYDQKPISKTTQKSEKEKESWKEKLQLLEEKAQQLEHFDAWLAWLFEEHITMGLDIRKDKVYYHWDMDTYPLPDTIDYEHKTYPCFIVSRCITDGIYENQIPVDIALYFIQKGKQMYQSAYQEIRKEILEYEEQCPSHY